MVEHRNTLQNSSFYQTFLQIIILYYKSSNFILNPHYYIVGLGFNEDISDLKKAIKDCSRPANTYENCPCNSGKKYKFCCMNKEIELDI
ncbi:YecA family protein [Bacillus sp. AFS023182]|uniref:YecA family protein n=1 Tax=Bacillus sp. AFS023182 TaxID=2033492 RepID=UPI0034E9894B